MNSELSHKKDRHYRARIGFAVSTILLLVSLEYKPHHVDVISPISIIIGRANQTSFSIADYHGSAEAILSKKGDINLLNVHLAEAHAAGGMLNAEFSGPLPADGETSVYELDEMHYVWLVEKDISDKRTRGHFVLRNENGKLYGEVLDGTGVPFTFVLKLKTT